jgi:hypothetical protein
MNAVVCVKQVPDTAAERTLRQGEGTLDRKSSDGLINELGEYPIFEITDFGIVGDLFTVVPQLLNEIKTRKG